MWVGCEDREVDGEAAVLQSVQLAKADEQSYPLFVCLVNSLPCTQAAHQLDGVG